jgi:hypothetical protein
MEKSGGRFRVERTLLFRNDGSPLFSREPGVDCVLHLRGNRVRLAGIALAATLLIPASFEGAVSPDYGGYRSHYQGYGVDTPGGRGGAILRVTNLNDRGPGSLRAALEAAGPRYVIFDTSGTIALDSPIFVMNPYVTIAGQTAPSPGINIRNHSIIFEGAGMHDAVVQHIRVRVGDTHQEPHRFASIAARNGAHRIVLDHVSLAWTMYMHYLAHSSNGVDPSGDYTTVLDSLFAFGLVSPQANATGQATGYTAVGGVDPRHTQARNLYVHNSHRQPSIGPGRYNIVNNVVYGSGPFAQDDQYTFLMWWPTSYGSILPSEAAIINTVTIPSTGTGNGATAGSDSGNRPIWININQAQLTAGHNKLWLSGNAGPYFTGPSASGQWAGVYFSPILSGVQASQAQVAYASEPSWHTQMNFWTISTSEVTDFVFANAGARPLDRDSVDIAAVAQARAGLNRDSRNMGSRIRSQNDMGGHPAIARNVRQLQTPQNPHAVAPGQTFRTNMEMWLEDLARALEPRWQLESTGPTPPPPPPNVRIVS